MAAREAAAQEMRDAERPRTGHAGFYIDKVVGSAGQGQTGGQLYSTFEAEAEMDSRAEHHADELDAFCSAHTVLPCDAGEGLASAASCASPRCSKGSSLKVPLQFSS